MKSGQKVSAAGLAVLAKQARERAGKTRQQAADEFGVAWQSVFQAEEEPARSLYRLRRRMIERYAGFTVEGPFYELKPRSGQAVD